MIDLHMHSRYSEDGEYTPEDLAEQCVAQGVYMMSVTDHNCARANSEAQIAAKVNGIAYITGIEIDCVYEGTNFHVLGYGIDFQSGDFEHIEQDIRNQSLLASLERLEKTQALGFHVTESDLWEKSKDSYWEETWTGDLFAEILLAEPEYADHPLLSPYRPGGSRSNNPYVNFYWDYYAQGKLCYAKMDYPSMEKAIETIHRNHGVAVLAHPGVNLKGKEPLLVSVLGLGIDGIEAFSSYHTPVQAFHYYNEAKQRNLFMTCGSDFHGKTKPAVHLGEHGSLIPDEKLCDQLPMLR